MKKMRTKILIKKPKQRAPMPSKPPKVEDDKKVYKRKPKHKGKPNGNTD